MYCRGCGYALIGLTSNRCPECGREFDPANPRTFLARPRRVVLRWVIKKIALVLVCLTLSLAGYVGYLAWQVHQEAKAIQFLRANYASVTTYDAAPSWAKAIFRGHAAWLWVRADQVLMDWRNPNIHQSIAAATNLKSLQEVDLRAFGAAVTDKDLAQFKGLTALQRLYLSDAPVTDAGLAQLEGLTALRDLGLSGCTHVTDAGLAHFKGFTALRLLFLSGTQVTDAGIVHLKGLTAMSYLDLNGTHVTDAGLAQLQNMTALQYLVLDGTHVTDAGVAKFENAVPACRISHRGTRL
jgi:hypothetical protein